MEPVLEAKSLSKRYPIRAHPLAPARGWVEAVREVSLALHAGESVGLVGESGCGKSTLARLLCRLTPPSSGELWFRGKRLVQRPGRELEFRRSVQIIFQDPMASLNPTMRVGQTLAEPMDIHERALPTQDLRKRVKGLLEEVGLQADFSDRFPQTLSGGQRQRVGIARALALRPQVLICDEPVSSLDLSVQAQILKLLSHLQAARRLGLLFISHDLATVSALCDRILVMHEGQIIEEGVNPALFRSPAHPYTRCLVELALQAL